MKKILLLLLFIFPFLLQAQHYGDVWQFGKNLGIKFTDCQPAVITGANAGFEGCAALSDASGQLLFYTNSDTVWNKNHQAMPNGFLIASSGTMSQVIAFKKPGSSNLYYVVTTSIQASNTMSLEYHVVDMSLNNGLGDVSSKNNLFYTGVVTEQLAATYHSNGNDIWLVSHAYGNNDFIAFLVSSSGFSATPVISAIGPTHVPCISNINARGEIKFSPNGTKLAFNANGIGTNNATNILCLCDFNTTSGSVSNPINLPYSRGDFGLSFSSDNSKLYGTTWKAFAFGVNDSNYLYQFDISSGNATTISNSKVILDSSGNFGTLKLAPNGKIYVRRPGTAFLGVINQPNASGLACNYVKDSFSLGLVQYQYGLNNYIEYNTYCGQDGGVDAVFDHERDNFSIYPNPVVHELHIHSPKQLDHATCIVYNIFSQPVYRLENMKGSEFLFSLKSMAGGVYTLEIREQNQIICRRKIVVANSLN